MEFIIISVIYKSVLKLVLLFQTLQLIAQRPIAIIYEETQKMFTNKSPWGIKTHDNMRTQLSPCEQETPVEGKEEQPLFNHNRKEQLGTHTRELSLWEWTKSCPLNFLSPPPTWCEQCPRAVTSAEAYRMMELHHLPQNCISSGRGAETKLFKLQQIDVKNTKNV